MTQFSLHWILSLNRLSQKWGPLQWVAELRQLLLSCDFDSRRELVHRLVKKVTVRGDRSAKMSWDLPATLAIGSHQQVPEDGPLLVSAKKGVTTNHCGGVHQTGYPEGALPNVELRFEPVGPKQWPFGYEVLRQFRYPDKYPVPSEYRYQSAAEA